MNFAVYLLIALMAAILESTVFAYKPLNYIQPDIILVMTVFLGFRRNILEGGIVVILTAIIMELHSGAGDKFYLAVYLYTFLGAKVVSRLIVVPSILSSIGIVGLLTLIARIVILLLTQASGGHSGFLFRHFFISILPGVVTQMVFTPILFSWFSALDLKTFKDEHSEDEYDINKGF